MMGVEDVLTPEEVVMIVRHLTDQGFAVAVHSTDPLELLLTVPSEMENDS